MQIIIAMLMMKIINKRIEPIEANIFSPAYICHVTSISLLFPVTVPFSQHLKDAIP